MEVTDAGKLLAKYWKKTGVPYLPGLTEETIREFERKRDLKLPRGARAYLKTADGTRTPNSSEDRNLYAVWPMRMWLVDEPSCGRLITFGDYCLESFHYGLYMSRRTGRSWVVTLGFDHHLLAAPNFISFARLVIADSPRLWDSEEARTYTARRQSDFDFRLTAGERKRFSQSLRRRRD
jgi:hypothetical protein